MASADCSEEAGAAMRAPRSKRRLDMVRWVAAFQAYALVAEAAEVCSCTVCAPPRPMRTCILHAAAEAKRYSLAIIYDENCRREWSQKASRGMSLLHARACHITSAPSHV